MLPRRLALGGCPSFTIYSAGKAGIDWIDAVAGMGACAAENSSAGDCAGASGHADDDETHATFDGRRAPSTGSDSSAGSRIAARCGGGRGVSGFRRRRLDYGHYAAVGLGSAVCVAGRPFHGAAGDVQFRTAEDDQAAVAESAIPLFVRSLSRNAGGMICHCSVLPLAMEPHRIQVTTVDLLHHRWW